MTVFHFLIENLKESVNVFVRAPASYVAFHIVKIDVTPTFRAKIDQTHLCKMTEKISNMPEFSCHCLVAITSCIPDNLKEIKNFWCDSLS